MLSRGRGWKFKDGRSSLALSRTDCGISNRQGKIPQWSNEEGRELKGKTDLSLNILSQATYQTLCQMAFHKFYLLKHKFVLLLVPSLH